MYTDFGRIELDEVNQEGNEPIKMIVYNELDLLTTKGQSGSALFLIEEPSKQILEAKPDHSPAE